MTALLTPTEVAALFRVDPATVNRWAEDGRLSFIRTLGGHRRYRAAEVQALLNGQQWSRQIDPVQTLVDDHYEGDPVRALKDLARRYGIAVTVPDREPSEDSAPAQPAPEQSAPAQRSEVPTQLPLTTAPPPEPQPPNAGLADLTIEPACPEPTPPASAATTAPKAPDE